MNRRFFLKSGLSLGAFAALAHAPLASALTGSAAGGQAGAKPFPKIIKTDAEWKRILTPEQFYVTRQSGTEAPYSSPLMKVHAKGIFACVSCDLPLFSSSTKFESGTGWPSFYASINKRNLREAVDNSGSEPRTEVVCARCDAHLGHVFNDGPEPTGLRYCMNGVAMKFIKGRAR